MAFVVVGEVDEEVLSGHQLHDGVSQELHPLVVAAGQGSRGTGSEEQRRDTAAAAAAGAPQTSANFQETCETPLKRPPRQVIN